MEYRCHVRALLRTVGFLAGASLCVSSALAGAPRSAARDKVQFMAVSPFWADDVKGDSDLIIFPGGEEGTAVRGERSDPCTLGDANTYDRPAGTAPYATFIGGQFNLEQFRYADDFRPDETGAVNRVCWRGVYSHDDCAFPVSGTANSAPHQWTLRFYNFDTGTRLPLGAPIATFQNFGGSPNMTVTQGRTGLPVGSNPNIIEMSMSASLDTSVPVDADTCYYVEWFFDTSLPCFYLQGLSYEATTDPPGTAEGNRSLLRRNARLFPAYTAIDFINIDVNCSIGFANPSHVLAPSNGFLSCIERDPPDNDNCANATAVTVSCGSTVDFDNTYATHQSAFDPYSCRKSTVDPTDYTSGDMWFLFDNQVNTNTSASVTLCPTNTAGGLAGGDSLLAVFRHNNITAPFSPAWCSLANLTQIGCSDDVCSGVISQTDITGLTSRHYLIRVSSFTPVSHGIYTMSIICPIPIPANDRCTGAINIPRTGAVGYGDPLGIVLQGQTRTARVDGNVHGCGDFGNTINGVWFKLTGAGNEVLLSTDVQIAGTAFDTRLSVYCGPCNPLEGPPTNFAGSDLVCVAYNDDKSETVLQSELTFCAKNDVTYFIYVTGFGTAVGDFGLLARELRDTSNQPIPCCDPQICDPPCQFEIALNAGPEPGMTHTGAPDVETCVRGTDDAALSIAAGQRNYGCNLTPPTGEVRRWGILSLGQTILGNIWSNNQAFDRDWYVIEGFDKNKRYMVHYSFASEGPSRPRYFFNHNIADVSDCQPMLGFVTNTLYGCPQEFNRTMIFDMTSSNRNDLPNPDPNTHVRGNMAWLVSNAVTGGAGGYPCGINSRYWFNILEAIDVSTCETIAAQPGDADENTIPTFDGTGGNDGFTSGEPCYNPGGTLYPGGPAIPPPQVPTGDFARRKEGCFATAITDGEFLLMTPGTPIIGRVDSTVGPQGGSRDIDFYKFTLNQNAIVTLSVQSGAPMTALITENDCGADAIGYAIAATRGSCASNGANADDIVVLVGEGRTYIVWCFSTDAFVAVGSGALFTNVYCGDPPAQYRLLVNASPLPDCSQNPPCPPGGVTKPEEAAEVCVADPDLLFDSCNPDNDGCSEIVYGADPIASGENVCGTLFSAYEPFPFDIFFVDQDYYEFTVSAPSKLTYSLRADGPARVLVADTGPGGNKCYDPDVPVRVLGGENAGACVAGNTGVLYLTPGTYTLIVSPGSLEQGLAFADFQCSPFGKPIRYSLSMTYEDVGSCCVGSNCVEVTQAECNQLGGSNWQGGVRCGASYTSSGLTSEPFVSIKNDPQATDITPLFSAFPDRDDSVKQVNIGPPFKLFGRSQGPQMGVSVNGYVTFGTFSSAIARAFPNTANPNAVLAPFFHDWDLNAPGGSIWLKSFGPVAQQTTIIEWNNVGRHENFSQRATFQLVLKRNADNNLQTKDDTFEFRYGTFVDLGKLDVAEPGVDGDPIEASAGAEDETGLNGINIPLNAAFLAGGGKKISFSLADTPCRTVVPPCCVGNADKAPGQVNFADITAVLVNFNTTGNPNGTSVGDADCNGVVNFADITAVLVNFLSPCPNG